MNGGLPSELRELRELFRCSDPVPERALAGAYAAMSRRMAYQDADSLRLIGDSAESSAKVRSIGPAEPRVLTFAMPGRVLELDLAPVAEDRYQVSGLVLNRAGGTPPTGDVVLRHRSGECAGALDEHGAFRVLDVPRGPLSVVFRPLRSAPAVADWLVC
ncbi:hypothetical protein SAMN05421805_10174 [Saccharopolyspora antimicrobica]|uniref:Uncharacterized protein n=1 Tax=Saccharopolyspora antimicrobica TaxID=455193 RepID=A0A1I4QD02_9PSEU|nr:hypothetical protein [Saccharopolyspora antimicrobica]RKT84882.1 hypothetical protein ATL45_3213 [Saccharopolyspora antimicrobica]SFM37981.1 hypothetical protein SAMN05421805_10174 [Saccharopolyspora antimicrobica]